jgi:hypothetical protein
MSARAAPTCILVAVAICAQLAEMMAQEARRRSETMDQIRREKFDLVLPEAMREHGIDMWIPVVREGNSDPLFEDLGAASGSYWGEYGYYVFTDRGGDRIERTALGLGGSRLRNNGGYDLVTAKFDLGKFVAERNPRRIGVNIAEHIGALDGLSHTEFQHLEKVLGAPYASRMVSAEALLSAFR